jgi:hypothetical protein
LSEPKFGTRPDRSLQPRQGDRLRADHRAWLFHNVKFNGRKILLAYENDLCTDAFHQ